MITTSITLKSGRKIVDLTSEEIQELRDKLLWAQPVLPKEPPYGPWDPPMLPAPPPYGPWDPPMLPAPAPPEPWYPPTFTWPNGTGDFYKHFGTICQG